MENKTLEITDEGDEVRIVEEIGRLGALKIKEDGQSTLCISTL